ncbi:ribonuclease H-like domain-containing protein, partial [Tanacetum coccineum]
HTLSRSSVEAEYCGVANVVAKTAWIRNLLRELHSPLSSATLVYCENVSAIYMSVNPVQHQQTKHIEIDIHFVRDMVKTEQEHYPSKSELLLTSNPVHKKVPVLLHANKSPIPESLVIIEYLDEIHPDAHQILPKAPLDRAESRFWVFYIDNTDYRKQGPTRAACSRSIKPPLDGRQRQ